MEFDASSLYPNAMWDDKSVYPKIDSGFAFKPYMKNVCVEAFNNQSFNQTSNESAILKIKLYNLPDLIIQNIRIKEKVNNVELNRERNGHINDNLAKVKSEEIVKNGGIAIEICKGV